MQFGDWISKSTSIFLLWKCFNIRLTCLSKTPVAITYFCQIINLPERNFAKSSICLNMNFFPNSVIAKNKFAESLVCQTMNFQNHKFAKLSICKMTNSSNSKFTKHHTNINRARTGAKSATWFWKFLSYIDNFPCFM